jgi:hypothetical protein
VTPPDPRHERLAEYVLGTLEPEAVAEVEAYLAASSAARAEVRALRRSLVTLTEAIPQRQPPPEVWRRLEATLPPHPPPNNRPPWLAWGVAALFALLSGAQLTWTLHTRSVQQQLAANERLITDFLARPEVGRVALQGPRGEALGSALVQPAGEVLFVLASRPEPGRVYQAWGHVRDDWEPDSGEQLTPLGSSRDNVFRVTSAGFASLYLSLEPPGGSAQPTEALARVPLTSPPPAAPLELLSPEDGASVSEDRVIVQGRVGTPLTALSYRLNGGEAVTTPVAGLAFTFTVSGLRPGENTLELSATVGDTPLEARLTLFYTP